MFSLPSTDERERADYTKLKYTEVLMVFRPRWYSGSVMGGSKDEEFRYRCPRSGTDVM